MAVYASPLAGVADKDIPRLLGEQLGLQRLDRNWLADDDGISQVKVAAGGSRSDFIPYTDRPIRWHTDGYYNPPERSILGMVLHCVANAADGGQTGLLDHEIAYLLLRDESPELRPGAAAPRRDDDSRARRRRRHRPPCGNGAGVPRRPGDRHAVDALHGAHAQHRLASRSGRDWRPPRHSPGCSPARRRGSTG